MTGLLPSTLVKYASLMHFVIVGRDLLLPNSVSAAFISKYEDDDVTKLVKKMLDDYRAKVEVIPVEKNSKPIIVEFDLAYSQLIDLDGKNQILTSNVWVRQAWVNKKVMWDPTKYGGVENIKLSPQYFWKPDIVLYNTIEGGGEMYNFNTKVVFQHNGSVQWNAPAQIKTTCTFDITFFPFDEQKCNITFGSWSYTKNALDMRLKGEEVDLASYTESAEWKLVSVNVTREEVKFNCCKHKFVIVTYTVHVQRRVLFYFNNIIIPCIILNMLTLMAFLLPHDSGERISLVITILLGLTVYMLIFTESIPNSSVVLPIIGKFSMACFIEISACLLITTFTSRCYFHGTDREMPKWLRFLVFSIMAPTFFIRIPKRVEDLIVTENEQRETEQAKTSAIVTCSNGHHFQNGHVIPTRRSSTGFLHSRSMPHLKSDKVQISSGVSTESHSLSNCADQVQRIADILERFDEEAREKQMETVMKEQWHFTAVVLDRFFFILFGVTILICIVCFYLQIPAKDRAAKG
ncbi:neuronal acetylcholine receptor subunit alpha-3-like isoform X2 [Xenia sp. Carnegie-2017]|nr:neuronal acetylcholine receptor subunit alpha-3-like isoform X2 [Xenia sp. Carnegie-2017]